MEGLTAWCVCGGSCTSPETFLCEGCVAEHLTSHPKLHFPQPLNQPPFPQVKKATAPVQGQQPAFQLVSITKDSLYFYSLVANAWKGKVTLEENLQANQYSSWMVLADGNILCSGGSGKNVWRYACIVGESGSVQRRADMSVPRSGDGTGSVCGCKF